VSSATGLQGSELQIHCVGLTHKTCRDADKLRSTVSQLVSIAFAAGVEQFLMLSGDKIKQEGNAKREIGVSLISTVFLEALLIALNVLVIPKFHADALASPARTIPLLSIVENPRVPVTKVRYGLIWAICLRALSRQIVQLVINFFFTEFHGGIVAGQHDDIVSDKKRQFFAIANFSTAGNQLNA